MTDNNDMINDILNQLDNEKAESDNINSNSDEFSYFHSTNSKIS